MIEVAIAVVENLKVVICILGAFFFAAAIVKFIHADVDCMFDGEKEPKAKRSSRKAAISGLLCFSVLTIPSIDDVWHVRIGLIKYNLASPENIKQGAEVIERIGKKLECRYLGCEEKKEQK